MNIELVIAGAALAISIFGVIAPWYSNGQARLVLRYERYPSLKWPDKEGMRDARFVVENVGPGDAYNVELTVFGQGEDISHLLNGARSFEWIPPGHSVHIPFVQPWGTFPETGAVLYSHGRFATNPAALRQRGKPNDLVDVHKLPRWRQQIHRNRREGIETPLTPYELS